MPSYYEILYLNKSATQDEIKTQFYSLSKEYHPDRNKNEHEKYFKIKTAYDVLRDPYKRNFYDHFGEKGITAFKDLKITYVITRIFDWINLTYMKYNIILVILNLILLPYLLWFRKNEAVLDSTIFCFSFFILAIVFALIIGIRCLKHFNKKDMFEEKMVIIGMTSKVFLIGAILVTGCLIYDQKISWWSWMIPYFILEAIFVAEMIMESKKIILKTLIPIVCRIATMMLFNVNIPIFYKIFIPLLIPISSLILMKVNILLVVLIETIGAFYLIGCLNFVCEKERWWLYLFGILPTVFILLLSYFSFKEWRKYVPTSVYMKQKMLEDI